MDPIPVLPPSVRTGSARTRRPPGHLITVALPTRLDPRLETIRESSDQLTRSAALIRVLQRYERGERFAPPQPGGPTVQLAWTLPEALAVLLPLRTEDARRLAGEGQRPQPLDPDTRVSLINAALLELLEEFGQGWGERIVIKRGWSGVFHAFTVEAWTAGPGRVISRGALRRTGGHGSTLPLEERPLAAGDRPGIPALPREGEADPLWELLELQSPEPRTVAVLRAPSAHAAVQMVKGKKYKHLGLELLDAQQHRPWKANANAASQLRKRKNGPG
ncbi:hypothetical protein QOL99_06045 [Deinococcus sp. MIMF12]|uniref:Uncharacterized protein n=1 Tax=Deinococcus rhizophilus TaxID=3049544 RepID=A0ABT7JF86_9DEIO|nr:hypothetical protein [Deinococcus rhizophilus]MDL2343711.1 hypothetical protein [Deinococcus rhizophilus]